IGRRGGSTPPWRIIPSVPRKGPQSEGEASGMQRIVTGKGADGSPAILFEGAPPTEVDFGKYVTTELWVTDSAPPSMDGSEDRSTRPWELEPPPRGSCFRIVRIAPDDKIHPQPGDEETGADFLEAHAT